MASFGSNTTSGGGSYSAPAKQWTPPPAVAPSSGAAAGASAGASVGSSAPSGGGGSSKPAAPAGPPPALQHLLGVGAQQASQLWGQAQTVVGMSAKWGVSVNDLYNQIDKPPPGLGTAIKVAVMGTSAEAQAAQQVSGPIKTADPGELPSAAHPSSIPAHQLPAQTFGNPIAKATVSGPISQGQSRPLDFGAPAVNAAGGAAKAIGKSLSGAFGPQPQPTPQVPGTPPAGAVGGGLVNKIAGLFGGGSGAVQAGAIPQASAAQRQGLADKITMAGQPLATQPASFGVVAPSQGVGSIVGGDYGLLSPKGYKSGAGTPAFGIGSTPASLEGANPFPVSDPGALGGVIGPHVPANATGATLGAAGFKGFQTQTQKAARSAIQNIWSGLLVQGKLPPGASRPNIAFTPNNIPGAWATVAPVGGSTINVTPSLVQSLLGSNPKLAKSAREAIVHEIAHTMQKGLPSIQTPVGRMLTEGGAESFGQAAAGSVGGARNPPAYAQWVQGPGQWVNRGQFGAPPTNFNPVSPAIGGVTPAGLPGISGSTSNPTPAPAQGKLGTALALANRQAALTAAANAAANAPAPGASALPSSGILPQWQQFLQGKGGLSPTVPDSAAAMGASQSGLGVVPYKAGEINKLVGHAPAPAPSAQGWSNPVPGFNAPGSPAATAPTASAPGSFASPKDLAKGLGGIANALAIGNKPGMANDVASAGLSTINAPVPGQGKAQQADPVKLLNQSPSPQTFAAALLKGIGAPINAATMQAMVGWEKAEGGHWVNGLLYNPLNTTQSAPGASNGGAQGNIKSYTSWNQGLQATIQTLQNGLYPGIVQAFKQGKDPGAIAQAVGASQWGTTAGGITSAIAATPAGGGASPQLLKGAGSPTSAVDRLNQKVGLQPGQPLQGYVNPFAGLKLQPNRIDQGVDYGGSGAVRALGNAKVYYSSTSSGWPGGGFIGYTLTDGPFKGKNVFVAENVAPSVQVGQTVKAGQPIGQLNGGGIETGWASSSGDQALAHELGQQAPGDPGGWTSAAGLNFSNLLKALGAPAGQQTGGPPHGQMPAGWPSAQGVPVIPVGQSAGGNIPAGATTAGSASTGGGGSSSSGSGSTAAGGSAATGQTAADQIVNGLLGTGNTGSGQNPWLTYYQQNTPKDLFGSDTSSSGNPFAISLAQKGLQSLAGVKLTNPLSTSRKVA